MEYMHIVIWIPAWVIAGLCPDGIAAPAVVDSVFIQVEPQVRDPFLAKHLFCDISHDALISCTVGASVDEQDLEWLSLINERYMLFLMDEFTGRTVKVGATPGRFLSGKDKTAYGALLGFFHVCVTLGFLS